MRLRMALCVAWGLLLVAGVTGCSSSFGKTKTERAHMYRTITSSEWQMAQDDFDHFMLMDRRSRLTRWH